MANENTVKMSFGQIAKNPYIYLLITVVSVMWYFIGSNKDVATRSSADCEREKTELRADLKSERTKNDNLVNSILIKQGVIEKLTVITDSLNNKTDDKIK